MSDEQLHDRLARLESLVEEQQATIDQQRERIAELEESEGIADGASLADTSTSPVTRRTALKAGGVLALLFGGVNTASANPSGKIGTSSDPLRTLYTEELNGGITGNSAVTSLTGDRLSVSAGKLTAASTGVGDSNGTILDNADEIRFGSDLEVIDEGNGVVTVDIYEPSRIAFVDDNTLRTLTLDGITTDYAPTESQVNHIGPPADLTGDGTQEVPYIYDDNPPKLKLAKTDGTTQTIDAETGSGRIAIGDWDEDGQLEIVYKGANTNSYTLHSVTLGEGPTEFDAINGNAPTDVAGIADFDGTGGQDIVWLQDADSPELYYSADPAKGATAVGYTTDIGNHMSPPADFDNDGTVEVAVMNSGDIDLVESNGTVTTLQPSYNVAYPMGAWDWTGTGTPDIMHINQNTGELHYYDGINDSTGVVTDAAGNSITPATIPGVV